jgi:predicted AlkP superfamily phosphohydrolase/phosphomutase
MDKPTPKNKIIIIGIDSGTWTIFDPLIERGHMPHLKKLRDGGASGILHSTKPAVTPVAWTTLMTGVNPGKHKITAWEKYTFSTNQLSFSSSKDISVETMWTYLSKLGYRVSTLNLPQTFPIYKINGIMVSGLGSPGMTADITYPAKFIDSIRQEIPGYENLLKTKCGVVSDDDVFNDAISTTRRSFENSLKLAMLAQEKGEWDLLLLQIQQHDSMCHQLWPYLTPEFWDKEPERADKVFGLFSYLDQVIGKLAVLAGRPEDLVVIASDHGHGPAVCEVKTNLLLQQWGYQRGQASSYRGGMMRLKRNIKRALFGKKMSKHSGAISVIDRLKLDPAHTRAFIAHSCFHAVLYLNIRGRQKGGIVAPDRAKILIEDIRIKFLKATDPKNGTKIFKDVVTPQELYGVYGEGYENFGDLILIPNNGYKLVRSATGSEAYQYTDLDSKELGLHYPEGVYVLNGSNIKPGKRLDAQIADITPTIYAAIGVPIPDYFDGKVLNDAFIEVARTTINQDIDLEDSVFKMNEKTASEALVSQQEEEEIARRLSDLGYMG